MKIYYQKGIGIGVLLMLIIIPVCLLTAWLFSESDVLDNTAVAAACITGLVLTVLPYILIINLLDRLQDDRRRRIEKICDLLAFSVLPFLLFSGIGILCLLDGLMKTSFVLLCFFLLPLILCGIGGFLIFGSRERPRML